MFLVFSEIQNISTPLIYSQERSKWPHCLFRYLPETSKKYNGNFKIKVYHKDDDMEMGFNFGSMMLDG